MSRLPAPPASVSSNQFPNRIIAPPTAGPLVTGHDNAAQPSNRFSGSPENDGVSLQSYTTQESYFRVTPSSFFTPHYAQVHNDTGDGAGNVGQTPAISSQGPAGPAASGTPGNNPSADPSARAAEGDNVRPGLDDLTRPLQPSPSFMQELERRRRIRAEFHNRQRMTISSTPLMIASPVLLRTSWLQEFCHCQVLLPCCAAPQCQGRHAPNWAQVIPNRYNAAANDPRNALRHSGASVTPATSMTTRHRTGRSTLLPPNTTAVSIGDLSVPVSLALRSTGSGSTNPLVEDVQRAQASSVQVGFASPPSGRGNGSSIRLADEGSLHGEPFSSASSVERSCETNTWHCLYRLLCLRCSVAEQTHLLFQEEKARGYVPYRIGMDCFFGKNGSRRRTFWTLCILDLLTLGLPCGCCYHGLGTALYGMRLRYLVRCRYRIQGFMAADFAAALCMPMLAVEQQAAEMGGHGVVELQAPLKCVIMD